MEDTLRVIESLIKAGAKSVLILVLMEDTLRVDVDMNAMNAADKS